jgi:Major Facilitator Superfamily
VPPRAEDWAVAASALSRLREWREAASAWSRCAETYGGARLPAAAEAWASAGRAHENAGAWEDAAVAWARSAQACEERLWPDAVAAWEKSASAWSHSGLREEAARAWERRDAAELQATTEPSEPEVDEGAIAGLRYLLRHRTVFLLIASFAVATLATGLTNATLPSFLEGEQGLGSGGYGFGIAALATGLLVGEALVGFSRVGESAGRWIGAGLLVMAALFVVLALTVHAPTALLLLALIGLVDGTTDVLFETVVQRETDPRYLGCVFGFASAFVSATMATAFAVAPIAGQLFAANGVILTAGVFLVGAGLIALAATVRLGVARLAPAPA